VSLPKGLDLAAVLPRALEYRHDDARWLIGEVVRKQDLDDGEDPHGYVRLNSRILRRVMAERTLPAVVEALENGGVLETAAYTKRVQSRGYRLAEPYCSQDRREVPLRDALLIERVLRERARMEEEQSRRRLPVDEKLIQVQRTRLTVADAADALLVALDPKVGWVQRKLLDRIRNRTPNYSISETGRRFNAITGVSRRLRPALRLDGVPIAGIDVRCTQPALLAAMIDADGNTPRSVGTYVEADLVALPEAVRRAAAAAPRVDSDFGRFRDWVVGGVLYDELVGACRAKGVCLDGPDGPRARVKTLVLQEVLAKKGSYRSPFEDLFAEMFPSVVRWVRSVNQADYCLLVRLLQKMESWLVVEKVTPRLVDRIPVVTLHDAIYAPASDLDLVSDAFQETFEQLGFQLQLKVEGRDGGP